MTTTVKTSPDFASRLVNGVLAIPPVFQLAKFQARNMMIKRAEKMGVPWRKEVQALKSRNWEAERAKVENMTLTYPDYYCTSFHAYEEGNLNWDAALEVEFAAYAVHATIWKGAGKNGDAQLRQSYHDIIRQLPISPQSILDVGCSVGMSTFALQEVYPEAEVTGLDLSPHFLAVANYKSEEKASNIKWHHAQAEATGLPDQSFDLISAFLIFHELPQSAAKAIFQEARRLLRPGGYFTIMDMNPQAEAYGKMPPYILTLLKSTEPYLDDYFTLDIQAALVEAGFESPTITPNSPRHRTIVASVPLSS